MSDIEKIINVELSENKLNKKSNVNPIIAFKEMIWNACDADANNINIILDKDVNLSGQEYIEKIIVSDDGHGLSYEQADNAFRNFGESEKASKFLSPKGRKYHGKMGEGRYTYFSLGSSIIWKSTYVDGEKNESIKVSFNSNNKKSIKISKEFTQASNSGMIIEVSGVFEKNYKLLDRKKEVIDELLSEFAAYLLAHNDINVNFDSCNLDVISNIDLQKKYIYKKNDIECEIKIIKWKSLKNKKLFICGQDNVVYHDESLKTNEENITMYLSSKYFDDLKQMGVINSGELDEIYNDIIKFAYQSLKEFINDLINNEEYILLQEIKNDEAYPFKNEINDSVEKEQQKIFDIVAVEIAKNSPQSRKMGKQSKMLTNQLILEAIKTNPSSIKKILEEVFNLTKEKQDELAGILDHVSLNNIIATMQEVTERIVFLDELYQIVYTEIGKRMKERTEFQKILLDELWIFGDKYKYGTDDQSLKNVLKKHLKELTKDDIELTKEQRENPTLDNIPDICLWNNQKIGDKFENLVVEIKRPSKIIGQTEWNQIEKYAIAVAQEPGFSNTNWQFVLIGKDFDSFVKTKLKSFKSDHQVIDQDNIKVKIVKWSDIIAENKLRYEYFKEKMKLKMAESDITDSINKRWNKIRERKTELK